MNNGQRLPDEQEPTEEQGSAALDPSQQGDRDTLRFSQKSLPQDPGRTVPARPAPRPTPPRAMPQDPERTVPMRPASGQRRQPPQQQAPTQRRPQPRDPGRTVHSRSSAGRAPGTEPRRPVPQRTGYVAPQQRPVAQAKPAREPAHKPAPPPKTRRRPARRRDWRGGLIRGSIISALGLVILIFAGIAVATVGYVYIAQQLPPAQELWGKQTQWVSSRIYDRDGALLWELVDPQGGRRTRVTLDRVSTFLIDATVATEDETFWEHRGFSPYAIARAFYQNLRAKEIVSGFSTITQQVARNLLLSAEERHQETLGRKFKEVVLAVEIERRYEKAQILEIYLNENNYGNLAYGIEAAAQTYFGKSAQDLNLAEAALLAGLPQSPAIHDPFVNPDGALARQADVLRLMVEATRDGHLSPGISQEQAGAASAEMAARIETLTPPRSDIPAPHFVQYVRQQLEAEFGPDLLYRGMGLRVYTTLDLNLQRMAESQVRDGVANLAERNVSNGALVAIDPRNGEIKAMVGSVDFNDANIDGQVNVALRCRQPGSSIKPLTYLAAFEQGWTPSTLIWDVRVEYPNPPNPPYVPRNYDDAYHGNTLLRAALANSYNVPAVKALEYVGVERLLDMADRLGVASLRHPEQNCPEYPYDEPPFYGLALTLGSGEAKLLEMTGAFAVFANGGVRIPPTAIRYIERANGDLIADYRERPGGRVLAAQHAYLITHILSDYTARCPAFGCPNTLELDGRAAAAKTGTTTDYRDAWAIGYTPELVTGVWVGNSDNSPMTNVPGSRGAGPIWKGFMTQALSGVPPSLFERPPGIIEQEICVDSGVSPSEYCPNRRIEVFNQGQPPLDARYDLWQAVFIDALSGLRANEYCMGNAIEKVFFVVPPEAREWAIARGYEQPPEEFCSAESLPQVSITAPLQDESVPQGIVPVHGQVQLPNFKHYDVLYGVGTNPQAMGWVSGPHLAQVTAGGLLTEWDTSNLSPGPYTLRVVAYTHDDVSVQAQVIVNVAAVAPEPTPTSPPTPTNTPLPTALPTETPLPTALPTETLWPTALPTETLLPTALPTETPLPEASPTPESSPAP